MKTAIKTLRLIVPICTVILTFASCNTEADLVADYALAKTSDAFVDNNLITDDTQSNSNDTTMVLEVQSNGTVAMNED